jgi:non-ribosomal peptide synthetase component F
MQACLGEWRPQYLQGPLIPSAFKRQAVLHPREPCLVTEDGSVLTYAQTDAAATTLARRLAAQGVQLDAAVGILLDRSPSVIVSMLAVHKVRVCLEQGQFVPCVRAVTNLASRQWSRQHWQITDRCAPTVKP